MDRGREGWGRAWRGGEGGGQLGSHSLYVYVCGEMYVSVLTVGASDVNHQTRPTTRRVAPRGFKALNPRRAKSSIAICTGLSAGYGLTLSLIYEHYTV